MVYILFSYLSKSGCKSKTGHGKFLYPFIDSFICFCIPQGSCRCLSVPCGVSVYNTLYNILRDKPASDDDNKKSICQASPLSEPPQNWVRTGLPPAGYRECVLCLKWAPPPSGLTLVGFSPCGFLNWPLHPAGHKKRAPLTRPPPCRPQE